MKKRYKRDLTRLLNNKNRNSEINASYAELSDGEAIQLAEEIATHPEVTCLDLTSNGLTDKIIPALVRITHLRELKLPVNNMTDDVGSLLINLTNLEKLDLGVNPIGNQCVEQLAKSQSLTSLNISDTQINNLNSLAENKTLTMLDVRRTEVDDDGIKLLNNHPTLQVLDISSTRVTATGLKNFFSSQSSLIDTLIISDHLFEKSENTKEALDIFIKKNLTRFAMAVIVEFSSLQIPSPLAMLIFSYMAEVSDDINLNSLFNSGSAPDYSFFGSSPERVQSLPQETTTGCLQIGFC